MQYLYVLILMVGISEAAQPSPVYRAGPTVLNAAKNPPSSLQQTAPTPQAEERESQVYGSNPETKTLGGVPGGNGNGGQGQPGAGAKPGPGPSEQLFSVVYYPQQQPQPQSAGYPMTYQAQQQPGGQPGGQPTAVQGGGYFGSVTWTDALVAVAAIGLVAAGSAMWYPQLVSMKGRAMRQLAELKSEDAAHMAKGVMRAIQRFSEMNNARE